jgi:hypothetical protein
VPSPDIKTAAYHLWTTELPNATDDEIDVLGQAIATCKNVGRIGIDVHRSKSRETKPGLQHDNQSHQPVEFKIVGFTGQNAMAIG